MLAAGLALLAMHASAAPRVARALDEVPALIRTPEGAATFMGEMSGDPLPDGLGVKLPAGFSAGALATLMAPAAERNLINAVGAKPWPGQPGLFVAIVCTGGAPAKSADDIQCSSLGPDVQHPLKAYVAVARLSAGKPVLVTAPLEVDLALDWRNSGLPSYPQDADTEPGGRVKAAGIDHFDLAAFDIAPGQRAFGLRPVWHDGFSGGFGDYQALYLFAMDGGRLRRVFAAPMTAFLMTAGSWNKNGSRQHELTEGAKVLSVAAQQTAGHFDLVLKDRITGKSVRYAWSAASGSYQPMR